MIDKPTENEIEASDQELDVEAHSAYEDQGDEQNASITTGLCEEH